MISDFQIPQENINQVSSDNSSELVQMENTSDNVLGAIQYTQQPPTLELPSSISINDGRIVLSNGETAEITTDPASKSFRVKPKW